jgi:hypothetical protein
MDRPASAIPRSLFAFSVFYGGMVCIAGVLGNKQVALGPLSDLGPVLGLGTVAARRTGSSATASYRWSSRSSCRGFVELGRRLDRPADEPAGEPAGEPADEPGA